VRAVSKLIFEVYDFGGNSGVAARDLRSDVCRSILRLGESMEETDSVTAATLEVRLRATLLVAIYFEPEVGDYFARFNPKLVADLRERVLPSVMRPFLSDMAQTPEALCTTVAQLVEMWPSESLEGGAFAEPWEEEVSKETAGSSQEGEALNALKALQAIDTIQATEKKEIEEPED